MIENIAHFKILDFRIPIGINEYHDLGYVNSIKEQITVDKIGHYFFFPPIVTTIDKNFQIIDFDSLELRIKLINKLIHSIKWKN